MGWLRKTAKAGPVALLLGSLTLLGLSARAPAQGHAAGYAVSAEEGWRFAGHSRRAKVVLLAGSIGAYRNRPYGRLIQEACAGADVVNLSEVGQGIPQLASSFQRRVLDNPTTPIGAPGLRMWLLFAGGLNSVGSPERSNEAMSRLFRLAHRRRFSIVSFSLTPWGTDDPEQGWNPATLVRRLRATRSVVEHSLGRSEDSESNDAGHPDVAIDLYDSSLRDRGAPQASLSAVRARLEHDRQWRASTRQLDAEARARRLDKDALLLSDAARWFLAPAYRGFDHIHPNRLGHRQIFDQACPKLPQSWQCSCVPSEENANQDDGNQEDVDAQP